MNGTLLVDFSYPIQFGVPTLFWWVPTPHAGINIDQTTHSSIKRSNQMPKRGLELLEELAEMPPAKIHKPNAPEEALPEVQPIAILDEYLNNFSENEGIPEILFEDLLNFGVANNDYTWLNLPKVSISMQMLSRNRRHETYIATNFLTEGIGKIRQIIVTMKLLDCNAPQRNDRFTISVEDLPFSGPRKPNFHFLLSLHDNKKTTPTKTINQPVFWRSDNTFEFSFYIHVENRNLKTKKPRKSNIFFRFNNSTVYTISPIARSHHYESEEGKCNNYKETDPVVLDVDYPFHF